MNATRAHYNKPEVTLLLNAGADVNAKDKNGWTALMYAVQNNNTEVITALLNAGADATIKNINGKSAIDFVPEKKRLEGAEAFRMLQDVSKKVIIDNKVRDTNTSKTTNINTVELNILQIINFFLWIILGSVLGIAQYEGALISNSWFFNGFFIVFPSLSVFICNKIFLGSILFFILWCIHIVIAIRIYVITVVRTNLKKPKPILTTLFKTKKFGPDFGPLSSFMSLPVFCVLFVVFVSIGHAKSNTDR